MNKQTILITGGTGLFGRQFVNFFSKNNFEVIFISTNESKSIELRESCLEKDNISFLICDLININEREKILENLKSKGRQVNHLINNARSLNNLSINEDGETDRKNFLSEYLLNVVVPYELSMYLYKAQPETLNTITNISSQYGIVAANPNLYKSYIHEYAIQYGISKAALNHLTKDLAIRFVDKDIRVNCVAYGGVEGRVDKDFKKRYEKLSPNKRMLKESEIVGPVNMLISETNSAINGQTIIADGGWTLW
jgi:hypothetical protein